LAKCEVCKEEGYKHHIVFKSEGGFEFKLNYKYLCLEHHSGKLSPHKNNIIDISYKLELQEKLKDILTDDYYSKEKIKELLELNNNSLKRLLLNLKLYKEGYKKHDIIFKLMGNKIYNEYMLEDFYDILSNF
jgi:hypothetical protein